MTLLIEGCSIIDATAPDARRDSYVRVEGARLGTVLASTSAVRIFCRACGMFIHTFARAHGTELRPRRPARRHLSRMGETRWTRFRPALLRCELSAFRTGSTWRGGTRSRKAGS